MLSGTYSGTDLSYAYINDADYTGGLLGQAEPVPKKKVSEARAIETPKMDDPPKQSIPHSPAANVFMSPDDKIEMLSNELRRQREYMEQQRASGGYLDKLISKKKDMLRMVMFACVVLLALSVHFVADHYYKVFFDNNILTPWRELFVRVIYPVIVCFMLWNVRAFVK